MNLQQILTNKMELKMAKIFAFITAAVLALTLTACGGPSKEEVAQKWVEANYSANVDEVVNLVYFTPTDNKEELENNKKTLSGKLANSLPEKKKEIDEQAGGVKSIVVKEVVENKNDPKYANAVVEVTFNKELRGSLTRIEKFTLIQTDSGWLVNF